MKSLLILRHAKSSWKQEGLSDHDRPLNKRGRRNALTIGALLADEDLLPELILSSTAVRAIDTARRVAAAAGYQGEIEPRPELYHAAPQTYLEALADVAEGLERVMVVGHNPGLEQLVSDLGGAYEYFPTAALAHIQLQIGAWHETPGITPADAQLLGLWRPRELD